MYDLRDLYDTRDSRDAQDLACTLLQAFRKPSERQCDDEQKANVCYHAPMDEGRKRVLLIAASILAARKLAQYEGGKRVPATVTAISDAVLWAEEIMRAIDERFSGR
jgi:hypothetical protein